MRITATNLNVIREPLVKPFGFKGGAFTEKWVCQVDLTSGSGKKASGQGGLAVLWSDAAVFSAHSEVGGNILMAAMLEYALSLVKGKTFADPVEMLDFLDRPVYEYGCNITENPKLRHTFALNPLVALDNAAWPLYAQENNINNFDEMIPEVYRYALSARHDKLASAPLVTYTVSIRELHKLIDEGYFFLKIKIGQPGNEQEMLKADMARLNEIHDAVADCRTPYTENGKLLYYLDANGRYKNKDAMKHFLDYARKIGAFEQIVILEEPFDEKLDIDVDDLGVRVAGDESCHNSGEVRRRIEMGYSAIALKPAGKTLSMSLKMVKAAGECGVPCYVADSACTPATVEWNKNIAARLAALPGMKIGLLESNGPHFYRNWQELISKQPFPDAVWGEARNGVFELNEDYYAKSGGIFKI
jgi:L-alanine-DL-glutamate epimerase-like enolase superfamily enzyme